MWCGFFNGSGFGIFISGFLWIEWFFPSTSRSFPWNWLCVWSLLIFHFMCNIFPKKAKQKSSNQLLPHTKFFGDIVKLLFLWKPPTPPTVCTYKGEDRTKTNPVSTPSPQSSTKSENYTDAIIELRFICKRICKNFYICRRSPSTKSGQIVFFKAWKYLLADVFSPPTFFF